MTDAEFERYYLGVVTHPKFRIMGLTVPDLRLVRMRMDLYAVTQVAEVLKEEPR